jgi:hypothetical protein
MSSCARWVLPGKPHHITRAWHRPPARLLLPPLAAASSSNNSASTPPPSTSSSWLLPYCPVRYTTRKLRTGHLSADGSSPVPWKTVTSGLAPLTLSSSPAGDSEVPGEIGVDVVRAFHSLTSAPSQSENDPFGQRSFRILSGSILSGSSLTRPTGSFEEIFLTWFGVAGFACGKSAGLGFAIMPGVALRKTATTGSGEFGRRIEHGNAVIFSIDSGVPSFSLKIAKVAHQDVPREPPGSSLAGRGAAFRPRRWPRPPQGERLQSGR